MTTPGPLDVRGERPVRYANVVGAIPFVLIGAVAIHEAQAFPDVGGLAAGPRFFPLIMGWAMILLSGMLAFLSIVGKEAFALERLSRRTARDWLVAGAVLLVTMLVWLKLGFVVASFVLGVAVVQYFERDQRWWRSLVFSGALAFVIWLLFAVALDVPVKVVG